MFDLPSVGEPVILPSLPDSEATTVAALRENFNSLLAHLRSAGLMESPDAP